METEDEVEGEDEGEDEDYILAAILKDVKNIPAVGSPQFISDAKALGMDGHEYYVALVKADKFKFKGFKHERKKSRQEVLARYYELRDQKYRELGYVDYDDYYIQVRIIGQNKDIRSKRIREKYIRYHILPMLEEWAGFFEHYGERDQKRLKIVNNLLQEFCWQMGFTVRDYPDHYANLRGYKDWQEFKDRENSNKGLCRFLKKKYCETKDPNSLFLSIDTLKEITKCKIPIREDEKIKKDRWLAEETRKIKEKEEREKKKDDEYERLWKIDRDERIKWEEQFKQKSRKRQNYDGPITEL